MRLIDTHTHLYEPQFDADREETIARAVAAGVDRMLFPAIDSGSHERMFALCAAHPEHCLPMMGLHPTSVNDAADFRAELVRVETCLARPPMRIYAVGEVGLDLYWSRDRLAEQVEAFEYQIRLALDYDLPLAIHTREAWDEMTEILGRYRGCGLRGVMHAFTGELDRYERVRACGDFLFGIGGMVTYRNRGWESALSQLPLEHLVLETDSPYLTPVPYRGKRNESAYVIYVCDRVAALMGRSSEEVARATTANAERLFRLPVETLK